MWNLDQAWAETQNIAVTIQKALPLVVLGIVTLLLTTLITIGVARYSARFLERQLHSQMLARVISKAIALPFLLLGIYFALRITGLSHLATTLLGGTGIAGIVIGIAFRDIAENFLASLLISAQRPFRKGDRVLISGHDGYVQSVTNRGTILMTLEGNHVQIPNSTVYKEVITNFSANPNVRLDFTVGIGYDCPVSTAQEIALEQLRVHPAVLDEPEPMVLAYELGAATVNLKLYFWVDGQDFSVLKVKSSVIRLVKQAFESAGISMPDEAREVVFPEGVLVKTQSQDEESTSSARPPTRPISQQHTPQPEAKEEQVLNPSEGDFKSEANDIESQARLARSIDESENYLN